MPGPRSRLGRSLALPARMPHPTSRLPPHQALSPPLPVRHRPATASWRSHTRGFGFRPASPGYSPSAGSGPGVAGRKRIGPTANRDRQASPVMPLRGKRGLRQSTIRNPKSKISPPRVSPLIRLNRRCSAALSARRHQTTPCRPSHCTPAGCRRSGTVLPRLLPPREGGQAGKPGPRGRPPSTPPPTSHTSAATGPSWPALGPPRRKRRCTWAG